jgi:STE24 endopeptidase
LSEVDTEQIQERVEPELITFENYSEENTIEKSKKYHDHNLKMLIIDRILSPLLIIVLIVLRIPDMLSDLGGTDLLFSVASVALGLFFISWIISLPFSIYGEHTERKYGFSTRSNKRWVRDQLLGIILGVIFGLLLLELLYFTIDIFEDFWWLVAFIGYYLVTSILSMLAPIVFIPLFMKITPLPQGPVRESVERVAKEMDLNYKDIYELKMSDMTTRDNAMVAGFGKTIRIMIGDNMINKYRLDEIETVMIHEIGHQKNKDIYKMIFFSGIITLVAFIIIDYSFSIFIPILDYASKSDPASMAFFMLAFGVVSEFLSIILLAYSRHNETQADLTAIRKTKNIEAFISSFLRMEKENLIYPYPSKLEKWFLYSHPPVRERIKKARIELKN